MKNILFPILLLILTNISASSQNFTEIDFEEDLEYIKQTLPQKHINLFEKISKTQFESKIDSVKYKAKSLNTETFINELFKLMVAVGDEHTRVELSQQIVVPVRFQMFQEGIFVAEISPVYSGALLSKVIEINEQPINDVINKFKEIILSQNQSYFDFLLLHYLNNASILRGLGILNSENEITYTLQNSDSNIVKIKFDIASNNINHSMIKANQHLQTSKNNYWYEYDSVRNEIYFSYSSCQNNEHYPFAKFNADLFGIIKKNKPEKIILDLRNNGGGNSTVLKPFLKEIKRSYLNKKNRFYVLIGKTTFSSAMLNAVDLKRNFKTVLIGEQTAGSINHYGEIRNFELPNTKVKIVYSTKYFETWKGKNGALQPDVKINYSIENFKINKDEAIDYIHSISNINK
ncbi:MAG: hypothetical protein LBP63_07325 [Prevotellaceae bacterium]|jgi:hypothetical protein|nr:hypothetical protein [Prevotellaceae bacterium]